MAGVIPSVRECLAGGDVILLPTETFYGLAVDPASDPAVRRVYELKGRPAFKALPVLAADWKQVEELCVVPPEHRDWLEARWPGKLTAILPLRFPLAAAGDGTLAIRIPGHPLLRALLEAVGPLTATSANSSGAPPSTRVEAALKDLRGQPELVLDGGETPGGKATEIIRFSGSQRLRVR